MPLKDVMLDYIDHQNVVVVVIVSFVNFIILTQAFNYVLLLFTTLIKERKWRLRGWCRQLWL